MTSAKQDEILDRRKDVWDRRVKGETVREIAEALHVGVATVHSDLHAVRAELDDSNKHKAELERAVGASRLDAAARKLLSVIDADIDVATANVEDLAKLAVAIPSAVNALARIEERRAKLLGLDAATKTELTGAEGGPLKVEDAKNALLAKLSGLAARESTESEAAQPDSDPES